MASAFCGPRRVAIVIWSRWWDTPQPSQPVSGSPPRARFGWTFAPGDKVMQIENDYDKGVYNGDIGYIDDVDPNAGEVVASFDG
jgi:ATP-dependent exoDNAse (exonuclease V) alpha subunit